MKEQLYVVNSIYPAFMGEVNKFGIGAPCTFLRLAGCNLRCYKATKGILCDTPEALELSGTVMSTTSIFTKLEELNCKLVCLTGGEPLFQFVPPLVKKLSESGYHIVVETNGSMGIAVLRDIKNVSFVVDYKSKSTGHSSAMLERNYPLMNEDDFIKFVLDDEEDYWEFRKWVFAHPTFKGKIAVGLFWGSKLTYAELLQLLREDYINVYVNMQTHKMSCLYDAQKGTEGFNKLFIPRDL